MIRFILTTAFFLVVGILGYNYFFGTVQEQEQAKEIFSKGADVIGSSANLLKSEYKKYGDGKYDGALDNISTFLDKRKEKGGELLEEIDNWKKKKNDWEQKKLSLQKLLDSDPDSINKEKLNKDFTTLEEERKTLEKEGMQLKEKVE